MSLTSYRAAPPRDQGWLICQAQTRKASFINQRAVDDRHHGPNWGGSRATNAKVAKGEADHDKPTATKEVMSSHPVETRHWSRKCRRKASRSNKKPGTALKRGLQNHEAQRRWPKPQKRVHAGRGQQTTWEIPDYL